jgi:protein CpxP
MEKMNELKRMRTAGIVLCGAVLAIVPAVAQQDAPPPPPPPGQMQGPPPPPDGFRGGRRGMMGPERRVEFLQKQLNLSDDQTAQVKGIFKDGRGKMEALRSNTTLAPEDRRTQFEALRKDEDARIKGVLTPDQKSKYEEMEARMREHMRGPRGGGPDGPPPPPPPPSE